MNNQKLLTLATKESIETEVLDFFVERAGKDAVEAFAAGNKSWSRYCRALSFPQGCPACNKFYASYEMFHCLKPISNDQMEYSCSYLRRCHCGQPLTLLMVEFRDTSAAGIARRKNFTEWADIIAVHFNMDAEESRRILKNFLLSWKVSK